MTWALSISTARDTLEVDHEENPKIDDSNEYILLNYCRSAGEPYEEP